MNTNYKVDNFDDEYDDFPDGVLTAEPDPNAKQYRIRDVIKYCKEKGIKTEDITNEELEQFVAKQLRHPS